ncbi:MAG: thiamine-monophosphate kinase [Frankiaceae bacterium]|jgi:thiamine-monophosphate kinase|nr:thiamine-monophosphate kinase [Frankiaceae bacterium]
MGESLGDVGEFALIERVTEPLLQGPGVLLGPGDDAAVLRTPDGRVVATTDLLVEGRHFRLDWSTPYDVGRKAAAQSLADVAAMGGVATALLVGLAAPASLPVAVAEGLMAGLAFEAARVGASVVGGDVVAADALMLAVTALGDLEGREPVPRCAAFVGDVLVVVGTLGGSAAGLAALRAGRGDLDVVAAHRVPSPPYDAGPALADCRANAMIDVSDGLSGDLAHLLSYGIGFEVEVGALPRHPGLAAAAEALGEDPLAWVLAGGEDHALVAALPPDGVEEARAACAEWPFAVVGRVVAGEGIRWLGAEDVPASFDHFEATP